MSYFEDTKAAVWRQIREMQERHQRELEPLIKILTDIKSMEPPEPIIIDTMALSEDQRKQWIDRLKASGAIPNETDE
jgi:hypothetical protein